KFLVSGLACDAVSSRVGWSRRTATALRTQAEAAAAPHAKVKRLPRCLDQYPITVNQRLCIFLSRSRAPEWAAVPNYCLCADDHQLLRWDIGQFSSFIQNRT